MKKNLLLLLGVAVMFFSCQKDNVAEETSSEALVESQELSSIAEVDPELILNGDSETLVTRPAKQGLQFNVASSSYKADTAPEGDIDALVASLPTTVSASTTAKPSLTANAYFDLTIHDTNLAGSDILAYCVDQDLSLDVEGPLDFDVYSSLGELPAGVFEKPENFDKVNWLLNQSIIGTDSPSGGTYTFGHIQYAMWLLVDDSVCQVCTYLTSPIGSWNNDSDNVVKGQELADLATQNGDGFVPTAGQKLGIVLVPEGKQSIIISKEVPAKETCNDCTGDVDEVTLKFNWHNATRIKFYQRYENTYWAVKIFDKVLQPGEEFTIQGVNHDGSFGKFLYIFTEHCYYTCFNTNCYINIGPGFNAGVFEVVSGTSTHGGELCEYTW